MYISGITTTHIPFLRYTREVYDILGVVGIWDSNIGNVMLVSAQKHSD